MVLCPQLVLRKWSELIPGGEFRCFAKENKLIGKKCRLICGSSRSVSTQAPAKDVTLSPTGGIEIAQNRSSLLKMAAPPLHILHSEMNAKWFQLPTAPELRSRAVSRLILGASNYKNSIEAVLWCRVSLHPAISQRDYTQYYQHILKQEEQICQAIQDFFSQHMQYNFLDEDCERRSFICTSLSFASFHPSLPFKKKKKKICSEFVQALADVTKSTATVFFFLASFTYFCGLCAPCLS